ncbi:hypothetical protein CRM22_005751 [Opisthorchis felineus]|uniref:Uncharacterized protein n=1 Tax=Opisthorchis felineus TaxID=147828 RepID=A0A4S2LPP3_OPIFE|nr:hypothetical protein CRM22_005751 [Opisthorchis felineus]
MSTDILHFDTSPFTITDEADGDQDDKRLRDELEQLIAEQFNDFDLGNDNEDLPGSPGDEQNVTTSAYPDDVASILAAGKLSLLEHAIQRFGEEENHSAVDPLSSPSSNTSIQARELSNSSSSSPFGTSNHEFNSVLVNAALVVGDVPTGDLGCNNNNIGPDVDAASLKKPSVLSPGDQKIDQNVRKCQQPVVTHSTFRSPYNHSHGTNWDTRVPEEASQQYLLAFQRDRDSNSSSVQTNERNTHVTQSVASADLVSHYYSVAPNAPVVRSNGPSDNVPETNSLEGSSDRQGRNRKAAEIKLSPITHRGPVGEIGTTPVNGQHTPLQLDNGEKSYLPSHIPFGQPNGLPIDAKDRRELLYAARGRQVEELTNDLNRVQDELAKEKRLAAHRLTLAEGERQALTTRLSSSEALIRDIQQQLSAEQESSSRLAQRLNALQQSNSELTNELSALRSTNESLSAQLIELTTGDAARRAEEREGKLTEALERRYALANEATTAELQLAKQRLLEKDKEVADLQRQLETCRSDANRAQAEFRETIHRMNRQLEDAQQHCQRLASSALCSEVSDLRQKLCELETSRKITEDVNKILQEELHDLREQISLYEGALRLEAEYKGDEFMDIISSQYNQSSPMPDPPLVKKKRPKSLDHVAFCENEFTICGSGANPRPSSAVENVTDPLEDDRGAGEFRKLYGGNVPYSTESFSEPPKSAQPARTPSASDRGSEAFRPSSHQKFTTSTPAPNLTQSPSMLSRLRSELTRALSGYKAKREQVTQLHEVVFTTRCQLHEAVEKSKRTEKNTALLQDRLVSLEQELTSSRELKGSPGPREHLLQGQVERLRADYAALEEELRSTRARLQSALGAEARALENEKAATERLNASAAERDAAIDRARAVCEVHYTSMRRRLEVDWANEREAATKRAEQALCQARQECAELEVELHRVTKLYQDAQLSTQQAVENALLEAMQEREAERIRFWREELPNQLAAARSLWEQEIKNNRHSVVESEKRGSADRASKRPMTLASASQTRPISSNCTDSQTNTRILQVASADVQTDITSILSVCGLDTGDASCQLIKQSGQTDLRVLPKVYGEHCVQCLSVQLLDSEFVNVQVLDDQLRRFLKDRLKLYRRRAWNSVGMALCEAVHRHNLEALLQTVVPEVEKSELATGGTSPKSDADCTEKLVPSREFGDSDSEETADPVVVGQMTRPEVLRRVEQLVSVLISLREDLDTTKNNLQQAQLKLEEVPNGNPLAPELYQSALRKIKEEVLNYVHTCQTRAAQTLHSELGRVHRRACRQFTNHLRQALYEAGAPVGNASHPRVVFPIRRNASLPRSNPTSIEASVGSVPVTVLRTPNSENTETRQDSSALPNDSSSEPASRLLTSTNLSTDLESLLHVIDDVCASTESRFQTNLSTGTALFDDSLEMPSKALKVESTGVGLGSRNTAVIPPVSGDFKSETRSAKSELADVKDGAPSVDSSSLVNSHPHVPSTVASTCLRSAAEEEALHKLSAIAPELPDSQTVTYVTDPQTVNDTSRPVPRLPRTRVSQQSRCCSEQFSNGNSYLTASRNLASESTTSDTLPSSCPKRVHKQLFNLFEHITSPTDR